MFTGATVPLTLVVTIVSALGLGILAGWATLAAVLHLFFATKVAAEAKAVPQRVAAVSVAVSHTA
jgi:hypothetical protein